MAFKSLILTYRESRERNYSKIQLIENILDLIFKVWAVKSEDGI